MKKLIFTAVIFTIFTFNSHSQNKLIDEVPNIEITGTAEIEVIPDEIFISISLRERQEGKENISIESQEKKLFSALEIEGLNIDNLSLTDADSDLLYKRFKMDQGILQKQYRYIAQNAKEVSQIFEILDDLKIQDGFISKVDYSKRDSIQREVRIMAIKAAKEKADYLLEAIGEKTGKPLKISPIKNNQNNYNISSNVSGFLDEVVVSNRFNFENKEFYESVQYSKILIKASYYVIFTIE
ncbi:MAG: SIMPL domain-containing protein [Chitinophagales bacterium]